MTSNEDIMLAIGELRGSTTANAKSLERIGGFIESQIKTVGSIATDVALVKQAQQTMSQDMKDYTGQCTTDRMAHEKRLTNVEGFQGRQIKAAGITGSIVALLTTFGVEWFKR